MSDREAGGRSVDPGWRSGRSPATRERLRRNQSTPLRPTLQHRTRHDAPLGSSATWRSLRSGRFAGSLRWDAFRAERPSSCSAYCSRPDCTRDCAFEGDFARSWGGVGGIRGCSAAVSAGIIAAATSSSTAGTSSSATTSWIFGAAFAACSAVRPRAATVPPPPARRARRRAGRRGARPAGARRRTAATPVAGQRASSWVSAALERLAELARSAARSSSRASRPGWRRPTSFSARRGASPAAIATRIRSSTSGSSASIALRRARERDARSANSGAR